MKIEALRLIFVHVPRCGGTAVNNAIVRCGLIPGISEPLQYPQQMHSILYGHVTINQIEIELDHCFVDHLHAYFCSPFELAAYKTLAFVRDPVERMVSVYRRASAIGNFRLLNDKNIQSFSGFCLALEELDAGGFFRQENKLSIPHSMICHFVPQAFYVKNRSGEIAVDIVEDCKRIDTVLKRIFAEHKIEFSEPERANMSSSDNSVSKREIDSNRERLMRMYAEDYTLGVQFE